MGSIPGWGRSPGEGNGHPLQYSCLANLINIRAQWAVAHGGHKESDTTEHKVHAEADLGSTVSGLLVSLEQPSVGPGLYEGSDACSSLSFNFCG